MIGCKVTAHPALRLSRRAAGQVSTRAQVGEWRGLSLRRPRGWKMCVRFDWSDHPAIAWPALLTSLGPRHQRVIVARHPGLRRRLLRHRLQNRKGVGLIFPEAERSDRRRRGKLGAAAHSVGSCGGSGGSIRGWKSHGIRKRRSDAFFSRLFHRQLTRAARFSIDDDVIAVIVQKGEYVEGRLFSWKGKHSVNLCLCNLPHT